MSTTDKDHLRTCLKTVLDHNTTMTEPEEPQASMPPDTEAEPLPKTVEDLKRRALKLSNAR